MAAFDDALLRYGIGRFTDNDVVHCAGLSVRAWRELIKTGAVNTITERRGRGHVRLCDWTVFKRAALIAALNRAGLSLAVSGHVALALPFHTLMYEICDPWTILFQQLPHGDLPNELPPRVNEPRAEWFDPNTSAEADLASDWTVNIYDGRFVGVIYDARDPPTIFGDLRNNGATFIGWSRLRQRLPRPPMGLVLERFLHELPARLLFATARALDDPEPVAKQLAAIGYRYERHDKDRDPLCLAADASIRSPLVTTSVNVTLAIRRALRRYLEITPPASEPK